jgi:type II secretory pathway component GspD/PulD (secretin)
VNANISRLTVGAALLMVAAGAVAQPKLSEVSALKQDGGLQVRIHGEGLSRPREMRIAGNSTYILEFDGHLAAKAGRTSVGHTGVQSIQWAWFTAKPPKVRVVMRLQPNAKPVLSKGEGFWAVSFGDTSSLSAAGKSPVMAMVSTEPFPDRVPPLATPAVAAARTASQSGVFAMAPAESRITLDFANTEVVQILRALAMQAGVNIVTAPEVKGTLTLSLDNVTVREGLDLVTTVAGLRYAQVGNAYIVTAADKFTGAVKQLTGKGDGLLETRVVPIFSGDAQPIRAAALSSLQHNPSRTHYQILLPTDTFKIDSSSRGPGDEGATQVNIQGTESKTQMDTSESSTGRETVSVRGLKEQYLVLVGPADGIAEVETRIRDLDRMVARAYGYEISADPRLARKTYQVQSDDVSANDLVKAISAQGNNRVLNCDLFPSPAGFLNQTVVIVGREKEVEKAEEMLRELDYSGFGNEFLMYDVKFGDPRALREALITQVRGLRATIPPSAAGTPALYTRDQIRNQANETVTGSQPGAQTSTSTQTQSGVPRVRGDRGDIEGLAQPFQSMEPFSVPMRLILRGTREQIQQALAYLQSVDVAPRQVALEMRVMELSREDAVRAGIDWSLITGGAVRFIRMANVQSTPSNSIGVNISGRDVRGDVVATLDRLATSSNLIARPNIVAMDGRETELFVGDAIRYIESIIATQNGITVTTGTVRVGVRLAVLPRIGGEGNITMDLRPVVSFLRGFKQIEAIQGELPQTSERIAQSTLSVRSGETIAIGGLIQDQDRRDVSGVPILMDLPIVGQLFRRTTNTKVRTELVIFLTAREVDGALGSESQLPMLTNGGGTPKERK